MREITQTVLASPETHWAGNCWQTCVACLLNLDLDALPPQAEYDLYETKPDGTRGDSIKEGKGSKSYYTPIQTYLKKHHSLTYSEVSLPEEAFAEGGPLLINPRYRDGYHMMTGRTVRSVFQRGFRHVVVARYGETLWDPHPSRAGLSEDIRWAFLIPYPKSWRETYERQPEIEPDCVCQACARDAS